MIFLGRGPEGAPPQAGQILPPRLAPGHPLGHVQGQGEGEGEPDHGRRGGGGGH